MYDYVITLWVGFGLGIIIGYLIFGGK